MPAVEPGADGRNRLATERLCDRVALINHGRIVALDSPAGPGAPVAERVFTVGHL